MITLNGLREQLETGDARDEEYARKQLHPVPHAEVVNRSAFIIQRCRDKIVLDIGASGPMHEAIVEVAKQCFGIDREYGNGVVGINLDDYHAEIPVHEDVEIVVCGEVIEHLGNPLMFLEKLRKSYRCPIIITVPNAFTDAGRRSLDGGIENVNLQHCFYFSYTTLKELVTRAGYEINEHYWYKGRPMFSEGLIFVCS